MTRVFNFSAGPATLTLTCFSRASGSRSITVTVHTSSPVSLSLAGDRRPDFSS